MVNVASSLWSGRVRADGRDIRPTCGACGIGVSVEQLGLTDDRGIPSTCGDWGVDIAGDQRGDC